VSSGAEMCRESGGACVIYDRWRALLRAQSLEALVDHRNSHSLAVKAISGTKVGAASG
jgi:hypothetical protein